MQDLVPFNFVKSYFSQSVFDFIWFADGVFKNYEPNDCVTDFFANAPYGFNLTEPSAIFTEFPISFEQPSKMQYYPCYREITPEQRGAFIEYLKNPYVQPKDIGYSFMLLYCLERHLYNGNKNAVKEVLRLRSEINNKSFLRYSANSLVGTSVLTKDGSYAESLLRSEKIDGLSKNLSMLCAYTFDLPFKNSKISDYIRIDNVPRIKVKPYANMSLRTELIEILDFECVSKSDSNNIKKRHKKQI